MLELLADYAQKHKLPGPGLKPKTVRWAIVCDRSSRFLDVVEIGDVGQRRNRGQVFPLCPDLSSSEMLAGGTTKSHFLVETAEVVALYGDGAADEKAQEKHTYFIGLLRNAAAVMPELGALGRVFDDENSLEKLQAALKRVGARPSEKVTFQVGGAYPVESHAWHDWWQQFRAALAGDTGRGMVCLVSGRSAPALLTHPAIDGLRDVGGSMGPVLAGFDKDAFGSYGLTQSENAAVSEAAAYQYRAALNDLIAKHSQKLTGAKVVHWFKDKVKPEDDPLAWLEEGDGEQELVAQHRARELLRGIRDGQRPDLADNHYYALTLSGAGGRVMVRDWMEGQFEELAGNIGRWFDDLSIVHRDGDRLASDPKFLAVLGAVARELSFEPPDPPAPFVTKMWRAAVRGEPIPQSALGQALARFKADIVDKDKTLNHAQMGLMKAYFVRKNRTKGREESDMKEHLNEEHPSPAYHCGRLMAVLAKLQQAALPDVGAGIVQRYYAAASATPTLVLGRIIRGAQYHLNKLDPGLAHWYEERLGGVSVRLGDSVPQTLTLEEQSLFALGYYQQWVELRRKKSDSAK